MELVQIKPSQNLETFKEKKDRKILIVEDEATEVLILKKIIHTMDKNITIDSFSSAEEALTHLDKINRTKGASLYDLLIIDIYLEGTVNGLDLMRVVEKNYSEIPIVITSSTSPYNFLKMLGEDFICPPFLEKPFSFNRCKTLLESVLEYPRRKDRWLN